MTTAPPLAPEVSACSFAAMLERLDKILARLAEAIDRPRLTPMLYRQADLEVLLSLDKRTIQRERSAGRFPRPDILINKTPLWRAETIRRWVENGGQA